LSLKFVVKDVSWWFWYLVETVSLSMLSPSQRLVGRLGQPCHLARPEWVRWDSGWHRRYVRRLGERQRSSSCEVSLVLVPSHQNVEIYHGELSCV